MIIAGVTVEDRLILKIAKALPHSVLASKLVTAYTLRSSVLNLTTDERRQVLIALVSGPAELQELHDELAQHPAWRTPTTSATARKTCKEAETPRLGGVCGSSSLCRAKAHTGFEPRV